MMRTYRSCIIWRMERNSWGGRWESLVNGQWVRSDTLDGIRDMINETLGRIAS